MFVEERYKLFVYNTNKKQKTATENQGKRGNHINADTQTVRRTGRQSNRHTKLDKEGREKSKNKEKHLSDRKTT